MNLRPDEITGIIKEQIKNYSSKLELKDIGYSCYRRRRYRNSTRS